MCQECGSEYGNPVPEQETTRRAARVRAYGYEILCPDCYDEIQTGIYEGLAADASDPVARDYWWD